MVARAIRAAPVPVISGVGHETDFTIADFVADVRAPTPSAAAEIAVPDSSELSEALARARGRLAQTLLRQISERQRGLEGLYGRLRRVSPKVQIAERRQRVDEAAGRASRNVSHRLEVARERARSAVFRLAALDPRATLQRGYAIVRRLPEGELVVSPGQVAPGDRLDVQVRDGSFDAEVRQGRGTSPPDWTEERGDEITTARDGPAL
jgi:exodeoxyribonuclease VII large subunit